LTVRQAAARLEVSSTTIYGLVAAGKLGCIRVGLGRGAIRITEAHIIAFMVGNEPRPAISPPAAAPAPRLNHIKL
jgi:excisionase family DNA binding protein